MVSNWRKKWNKIIIWWNSGFLVLLKGTVVAAAGDRTNHITNYHINVSCVSGLVSGLANFRSSDLTFPN